MGHRVPFVIEPILWSCLRAAVKNLYSPLRIVGDAPGRVEHCWPVSHRYSLIYALRLDPGQPVPRSDNAAKETTVTLFSILGCALPCPLCSPERGNKG